jgi:phosphatidylserine/phosphatidylglycerophosphate/cardiolipin synthase-like enzyme
MTEQFFVMPDDGMDVLIAPLSSAQRSIDIYVFTLSNAELLAALREAVARGVTVRALVDMHPSGNDAAGKAAFDSLEQAGVKAHPSPGYFAHLHAKSYVVDSAQAMISSVNYLQDWERTRDFGMLTSDDGVVQALAATFAADWGENEEQTSTVPPSPLVLSPNNSRSAIAALIASAKRSLIMEEEQITDPDIISALAARSNAGVSVQLVTNSAQEKNYGPLASLAAQAPGVKVGYSSNLWLHSKLLISDGAVMLVGSVNLTAESLDKRREVSILITDQSAIARADQAARNDLATSSPNPLDRHARPPSPADSPSEGGHQ